MKGVASMFSGMPIEVGVDIALSYRNNPIPYIEAHSGRLTEMRRQKGKLSEYFSPNLRRARQIGG